MKIVAIILNIGVICLGFWILADEGLDNSLYDLFYLLLFGCPIVNLFVLWQIKKTGKTWLALYFKRKRLEEQQKIDALNKNGKQG